MIDNAQATPQYQYQYLLALRPLHASFPSERPPDVSSSRACYFVQLYEHRLDFSGYIEYEAISMTMHGPQELQVKIQTIIPRNIAYLLHLCLAPDPRRVDSSPRTKNAPIQHHLLMRFLAQHRFRFFTYTTIKHEPTNDALDVDVSAYCSRTRSRLEDDNEEHIVSLFSEFLRVKNTPSSGSMKVEADKENQGFGIKNLNGPLDGVASDASGIQRYHGVI
ncbi:hypothetical protein DFJ58DRAFT_845609 [Suillus subalutaceus]|uniref:uncharacterized protein n=1 Tax=Suillus subalutaceus TaxID=48586 RepID=UPI001B886A5F|nr:uncharacterized protein DFJ58DRAFT_845609 [Suillus subalutaceus]KAG1839759.1 hypothetical protein DFJ58DRAFT_845609 [Suillus subalutaceus]